MLDRAVRGEMGLTDALFFRLDDAGLYALAAMLDADVPYLLSVTGVDRVIVHKHFLPDETVMVRMEAFFGPPEYSDDQIAAFVVPRTIEPSEYLHDEFAFGYP